MTVLSLPVPPMLLARHGSVIPMQRPAQRVAAGSRLFAASAGTGMALLAWRHVTTRRPILPMTYALMAASSRSSVTRRAAATTANGSDAAVIAELNDWTRNFQQLTQEWQGLSSASSAVVSRLVAREEELKQTLKACQLGDPTETTTAPRHVCTDPVVTAHGAVTRAVIEADLARSDWEVEQLRTKGEDSASLVSALVNSAILRLRLFDIDGAYEVLQEASTFGMYDSRLELLTRYCAQLKAPRHSDLLSGEDLSSGSQNEALLAEMRRVFLANDYHTGMVLEATKARSMSEFIFVDSRADQLEQGLLDNIEETNPMKPEVPGPKVPVDLVDLIRVFLLHRMLPLARICQLFGPDCTQLLLSLQVITAIEGNACRVVPPDEAIAAVAASSFSCGAFFAVSNVAIWPLEEDLLIATDFEQTFSSDALEPVMYLSEDSLALVYGAPREPVHSVLDVCCGSGVQGIVALRYYADRATFVDLNPRAPGFVQFNLALNGLSHKVDGIYNGNLYTALPESAPRSYDAILANPPFVPNPKGIASGAGAMFGNGGDTGEQVFSAIVKGAAKLLGPGGRLSVVAMTPNVEGLPGRMEGWFCSEAGSAANFEALVFRGPPTPASRYLPTSSSVETTRYQAALKGLGITTLSEVVAVLSVGDPQTDGPMASASLAGDARADLWSDQSFLRLVVQKCVAPPPTTEDEVGQQLDDVDQSQYEEMSDAAYPPLPVQDTSEADQAAATLAAAVAAASAKADGRPASENAREGNLPGFQPGFFPAYCSGPSAAWVPTARELEGLASRAKR